MRRGCRLTTRTGAKGIAHWVDLNLLTWQSQATQRNTEKEIGVLTLQSQAPQHNTEKEIGVLMLHSQCWLCNVMLCCAPLEKDWRRWIPVVGSSLGSLVVFGSLFGVTTN